MRIWEVPTECLCQKHCGAEHGELHMLLDALQKGRSIKGHVDKGQCDLSKLKIRHEQLVKEMDKRKYNHRTPLKWNVDFLIVQGIKKYGIVEVDIENNLKVLAGRCEKCKALQIKYGYYIGEV